ncbi:uncharacterized protein LOC120397285 [Mauremys reevesii]|uniref:uncharacterized protein LOC120397285 n=1 Tax=Mauremys reevesii TaxID=260615 RepID=UPI00193F3BB8|nr:uncharacterized protein LOC120397285 [Mauremys reevesii]
MSLGGVRQQGEVPAFCQWLSGGTVPPSVSALSSIPSPAFAGASFHQAAEKPPAPHLWARGPLRPHGSHPREHRLQDPVSHVTTLFSEPTPLAAVDLFSLGPGEEPSCESQRPDLHVLSLQSHHRGLETHGRGGLHGWAADKPQDFDVQEATRYWASQALYWLFTPCKAIVHTRTEVVVTVMSMTQKDASCRESPAHVAMPGQGHLEIPRCRPHADQGGTAHPAV